jgi:hypothetical protein
MMEVERVENVLHTLDRDILFPQSKLEHSFDDIQAKKTSTFRNELVGSYGIDAARVVELDLYDEDDSEDEGEVMLLAMILLQLHGVKFPGGFPDQHNKKKRQRTSPDQLAILETIFQTDKMPSQQTRVQLADQLGMSSRRVQIWFQNKRAKVKRGVSKSEVPSPLHDSRDSLASSSSGSSEPSSPVVPEVSPTLSSVHSLLSSPHSPASLVPSSPSLHSTPKHHTQVSQIQFSLSSLAQQPILLPIEFSLSAC